jgi:hypothetical protein
MTVESLKTKYVANYTKAEHDMKEFLSQYQQTCLETERAVERLTALQKRGAKLVGASRVSFEYPTQSSQ